MNYSKSFNRKSITKRLIILCVIVAVVSGLVGSIVGYAVRSHTTTKEGVKQSQSINGRVSDEFAVYGAYDDRVFTKEISLDWETGDRDFIKFDVKMVLIEQEYLFYLCKGYNLDYSLMMAVIQVESDFDKDLISNTNDYGYMQINKMNHAELTKILGVTDYLDPEQNMRAGCYIFRKLFEKYQQPNLVLMAYNMGETGAGRLWKQGVYSTDYTEKVLQCQKQFNEKLEGD